MTYDLTNLTSAVWGYELLAYANEVTNNVFIGGFMIFLFITILLSLSTRTDFIEALATANIVCFMASLFLVGMGMLNFQFLIVFLVFGAGSVFYKIFSQKV